MTVKALKQFIINNLIQKSLQNRPSYSITSNKFEEMAKMCQKLARDTNPKVLCLDCWSVETRNTKKYDVHKFLHLRRQKNIREKQ